MKFKGTLSLLGLLIILVGWVYWSDVRGREERERAADEAGRAIPDDSDTMRRIVLTHPDRRVEAIRGDAGWEFVTPPGIEADSGAWDMLASNVSRIEREATLDSGPESLDLSTFALDVPSLGVEVEFENGMSEAIIFGRENPGGTHRYAKLASSPEVFLVPISWMGMLDREVNDLRDKTILRFEPDAIDRIEIAGSTELSLVRDGDDWALETPLESPAAPDQVSAFLGSLGLARATGFADFEDREPALADTGLDTPRLRITLRDTSGGENLLLIGTQPANQPDSYYARDASRDAVFIINGDIIDDGERPLFDWRDKTIAGFDRSSISSVHLERDGGTIVLAMAEDGWELPGQGPARLETLTRMFSAVEFERVADIIDNPGPLAAYGLDVPRMRVVFEADGGEALAFGFGRETPDGDSVYWKSDAEPEVKVVSREVFERFDVGAEDLLEAADAGAEP